jgi:hypothetical protein
MKGHADLERRLEAFYTTELPVRAPDWVLRGALTTIETTPQRRALWPAWRISALDTRLRIAVAAAAVVVIAIIGYQFLPNRGGVGGGPTPPPAPSLTPSPSFAPTVVLPTPPPLSQTFDSTIGGISISYPEGWATQAATQQATSPNPFFLEPFADFIYDPALTDHLFLALVSLDVGASTAAEWIEATAVECTATEAFTVDGVDGAICTGNNVVLVSTGGRGYAIYLYTSGDEGWLDQVYDRAWFETVLATVQLRPEDAINPSPAPS